MMKKTIAALALATFCAGCEQRVETPATAPKETTVIVPTETKTKESKTVVVPAPVKEKTVVVTPPAPPAPPAAPAAPAPAPAPTAPPPAN